MKKIPQLKKTNTFKKIINNDIGIDEMKNAQKELRSHLSCIHNEQEEIINISKEEIEYIINQIYELKDFTINIKQILNDKDMNEIMREMMGFTGIGANPDSNIKTLSGGEKQGVAIGRAMHFDADLVILDEPTMALSLQEVEKVLDFIRNIKKRGKSCIYISHNIANVYPVSDRFVVLDRGEIVGRYEREKISLENLNKELVELTKVEG